jgi:hypothetical protein
VFATVVRGNHVSAVPKPWFRRKRIGFGVTPQTWQGWVSVALFLGILAISVTVAESWGADETSGRNGAFVIAALEIMGFMIFVRRHTEKPGDKK